MYEMCVVVFVGNVVMVCEIYFKLFGLYWDFFCEVNLILVKWVVE